MSGEMSSQTSLDIRKSQDKAKETQCTVFTRWINARLRKTQREPNGSQSAGSECHDLLHDLRDGHLLLDLLHAISGERLRRNKGALRAHYQANVDEAFQCLSRNKVDYTGVTVAQILDGDPKGTLGLIWTIICFYKDRVAQTGTKHSQKEVIKWFKKRIERFDVPVTDVKRCWKDGMAFSALIAFYKPDMLDMEKAKSLPPEARLENAFSIGETEFGIARLLEPEEVPIADEKSMKTYLWEWYQRLSEAYPDDENLFSDLDDSLNESKSSLNESGNSTVDRIPDDTPTESQILDGMATPTENLDGMATPAEDQIPVDMATPTKNLDALATPTEDQIRNDMTTPTENLDGMATPTEDQIPGDMATSTENLDDMATPTENLDGMATPTENLDVLTTPTENLNGMATPTEDQIPDDMAMSMKNQFPGEMATPTEDLDSLVRKVERHLSQTDISLAKFHTKMEDVCLKSPQHDKIQKLKDNFEEAVVKRKEGSFRVARSRLDAWLRQARDKLKVSNDEELINENFNESFTESGKKCMENLKEASEALLTEPSWENQAEVQSMTSAKTQEYHDFNKVLEVKRQQYSTAEFKKFKNWVIKAEKARDQIFSHECIDFQCLDDFLGIFNERIQAANFGLLEEMYRARGEGSIPVAIKGRYLALACLEVEDLLQICGTFFDEVLLWISEADQLVSAGLLYTPGEREKSPQSMSQDLLEKLPGVRIAVGNIKDQLEDRDQRSIPNPPWLTDQLVAIEPKLDHFQSLMEAFRRVIVGSTDFNAAKGVLQEKIAEGEDLLDVNVNPDEGVTLESLLEKYEVLFTREWYQDGDDLLLKLDGLAEEVVKGSSQGEAQRLEEALTRMRWSWQSLAMSSEGKIRMFKFHVVETELKEYFSDADDKLRKAKKAKGPLKLLEKAKDDHEEFFRHMNFTAACEQNLSKMASVAEEDREFHSSGESPANFHKSVTEMETRLTEINEEAERRQKDLEKAVDAWRLFYGDMQEIISFLEQSECHLLGLEKQLEKSVSASWKDAEELREFLEEVDEFSQEVNAYADEEVMIHFRENGEHLKRKCEANDLPDLNRDIEIVIDRYEQLKGEVNAILVPLEFLLDKWARFTTISLEVETWLTEADAILKESEQVGSLAEAEEYGKRLEQFFAHHKLQNSKLTCLSQLSEEIAAKNRDRKPAVLSEKLDNLVKVYDRTCFMKKSVLDDLNLFVRLLGLQAEVKEYLDELDELMRELKKERRGHEEEDDDDVMERLHRLLQDMMHQQGNVAEAENLHERFRGRNLPSNPRDLKARLEKAKRKQAELFERRELDEEARELAEGVEQELKDAGAALGYEVQCQIEKDDFMQKKLEVYRKNLSHHLSSIQSLKCRLSPSDPSSPVFRTDQTEHLDSVEDQVHETMDALKSACVKCQEAICLVQGLDLSLKVGREYVRKGKRLLHDGTMDECLDGFGDEEVVKQRDFLSSGKESVDVMTLVADEEKVARHREMIVALDEELEAVVKCGLIRLKEMEIEAALREAEAGIAEGEAVTGRLEEFRKALDNVEVPAEKLQEAEHLLQDFNSKKLSTSLSALKLRHSDLKKHLELVIATWLGQRALVEAIQSDVDACKENPTEDLAKEVEILSVKVDDLQRENETLAKFLTDDEVDGNGVEHASLKEEVERLRSVNFTDGESRDFEMQCRPLHDWLEESVRSLDDVALGSSPELEEIKEKEEVCSLIQSDLSAREDELNKLKRRADQLRKVLPESQRPGLDEVIGSVQKRWTEVQGKLEEKFEAVKDGFDKLIDSVKPVAEMEAWMNEKEEIFRQIQKDPSDERLPELDALSKEIKDRMDLLEQSPDESAPDLLDQFYDFSVDVEDEKKKRKTEPNLPVQPKVTDSLSLESNINWKPLGFLLLCLVIFGSLLRAIFSECGPSSIRYVLEGLPPF